MSATVSHEIRGPLEAIQNLQHLILTTDGIPREVASFARATADEASRVLDIAQSSLSFIRQTDHLELIDICAALDSIRFLIDPLIREKHIDFQVESHGDCMVECYAGETRQVLLNVVRNACEAITRNGSKVTVSVLGRSDLVEVIVTDQGSGIAPEVLSRIFEFGVTTKGVHGNGMGLWTVRQILSRYGGEVKIQSASGEGTRLEIDWPRRPLAAQLRA